MSSGIYLLNFLGTDKVYIGQSSNIEVREKQHKALFKGNNASKKMQEAYNLHGMPTLSILCLATQPELDDLEYKYIAEFDSVNNGFNTRKSAGGGSNLWGDLNGRAKYSNQQIIDCLYLLISDLRFTYPIITLKTGVPKSTIVDIANCSGHTWLEKIFPEEYLRLRSIKNKRNTSKYLRAVSPLGEISVVEHLSNFCKEHNLPTGNISKLLRGKCKSYGSWTAIA
jgi:hypothetical protein